jgi:hypothetical protein
MGSAAWIPIPSVLGWLNFFFVAFVLDIDVNGLMDVLRVFFFASEDQSVDQPCNKPVYYSVKHGNYQVYRWN